MRGGRPLPKTQGFTIVELLIVIVVIGILAAITVVGFNGVQESATEATLKTDLANAERQLENTKTLAGSYPASTNDVKKSDGTTFEYTVSGAQYCITASSDSTDATYFLNSSTREVQLGTCPGHSGGTVVFDQPSSCPTGYIPVPGNSLFGTEGGFCVMKYEAKNNGSGGVASTAAGIPYGYGDQSNHVDHDQAVSLSNAACAGCHMISESEWLTIAHDVLSVASNWSGGAVGSGYIYSGHSDGSAGALAASGNDTDGYFGTGNASPSNQRRTLSLTNGEVIWDFAGNQQEWTPGLWSEPIGNNGLEEREWPAVQDTNPPALPNPFPSYGTPAASGWTSAQGIGKVYSDSGNYYPSYILRGGAYNSSPGFAGIFAMDISWPEYYFEESHGFRVAQ